MFKKKIFFLFFLSLCIYATAQNPYVLNGNATQDNCHCYTLTTPQTFESGSIWNKNKIDLSKPFDYYFNVFLGCLDFEGADGMVFVLQPVSTSLGSAGEGIGFDGIMPSVGIEIDTYQNFNRDDPSYDHIAIMANGDVTHSSVNNLAGPVSALANSDNIEDCKFHVLHITWQPATNLLKVSMDGSLRLSLNKNIVSEIFKNDPLVYWGFTSATGGSVNTQRMCTSLDAGFFLAPHVNTCIGTPLTFIDSSFSFGSITNWYWNFGDGLTANEKNPPPHLYSSPGTYNVTLNIEGNDGCLSDTSMQTVTIGAYPVADFNINLTPVCTNRTTAFTDATKLQFGTESYWYWNFGNGKTSKEQNPPPQSYNTGIYPVKLFVKTKEGCASDTAEKFITVKQAPVIDFTTSNACNNTPVLFTAKNYNDTIAIKQWYWHFDDGSFSTEQTALHIYANGGRYHVKLVAKAENGCLTDTISRHLKIYATNAYAGHDTTILLGYSYQLQASGGDKYTWSPSTGLDNAFIADPITTLNNDITYVLTASTVLGCETSDTLHLKVVRGPEIYVPGAFTPNGDGKNDRFKIIPVGIAKLTAFSIFNRWGQMIYSSTNTGEGWDGTYNGVLQPSGTYIWIVTARSIEGKHIKKQGVVVLIR